MTCSRPAIRSISLSKATGSFRFSAQTAPRAYTRDGSFKMSADGRVVTSDGYFLLPEVTIPEDADGDFNRPGRHDRSQQFGQETPSQIGQIELARFINPAGLSAIGKNILVPTGASGDRQ